MADIHVLSGDGIDDWNLIFHFTVPNVNNNVGINFRTAIVNSGLGGTSTMTEGDGPGQITSAELAQIQAGILYEYSTPFPAESGATNNTQLLAAIQAAYAIHHEIVMDRVENTLRYFGFTGSAI